MKHLRIDVKLLGFVVFAAGPGEWLISIFGQGNLFLFLMTLFFMLVEMFTCMIIGFLGRRAADEFGFREVIDFWVKRSILLCLPLVGFAVDWTWHIVSGPESILGSEFNRYATRTIGIGLLGYQLKQVVLNVLKVYHDFPLGVWLIRMLSKFDPPTEPRAPRRATDPVPPSEKQEQDAATVEESDPGGDGALPSRDPGL